MTTHRPSLEETYRRWRISNPIQTASVNSVPSGFHRCRQRGCVVLIGDDRQRVFCFGHGGKPNEPSPDDRQTRFTTQDWENHQKKLRKGKRLPGVRGRPYQS